MRITAIKYLGNPISDYNTNDNICVKSAQIRSFFWSVIPIFGPEKTPYLDTFHGVNTEYTNNDNNTGISHVKSSFIGISVINNNNNNHNTLIPNFNYDNQNKCKNNKKS